MRIIFARILSILGHPALLVPVASVAVATDRGASSAQLRSILMILASLVLIVLAFSVFQVKSGRWSHVDAVRREDRKALNAMLLGVLLIPGLVLLRLPDYRPVGAALALGGGMVMIAMLLSQRLKSSLHLAFGAFSTLLLWRHPAWLLAGIALLVGVAWSRLLLKRHTPVEIVSGTAIGTAAGLLYNGLIP